jgi:uroporphyrinogen-III synthase
MLPDNQRGPLEGKRVVVTRAAEQAGELTRMLDGAGAEVLLLPLLQFVEAKNKEPLDAALRSLGSFDWLIFTSANAVRFVAKRQKEIGLAEVIETQGVQTKRPRVAAVGPATASAIGEAGFCLDMVASRHSGRELGAELASRMQGARVFLPRSNRADDLLPTLLREAGAEVTEAVAYRTEQSGEADSDVLREICRGSVDVITLASPSAFHALAELLGTEMLRRISERTALAVAGPTTAAAIRQFGLPLPIAAGEATSSGIVEAIIRHCQSHKTEVPAIGCAGVFRT